MHEIPKPGRHPVVVFVDTSSYNWGENRQTKRETRAMARAKRIESLAAASTYMGRSVN